MKCAPSILCILTGSSSLAAVLVLAACGPVSAPPPPARPQAHAPKAPATSAPQRSSTASIAALNAPSSHVQIAIGPSDVALSAELDGEAARAGVWLGIGLCASRLPEMWYEAGTPGFQCDQDPWGSPREPDYASRCEAAKTELERFAAEHEARFKRVYLLDGEGIYLAAGHTLSPVDGAKVTASAHGRGIRLHGTFPLAALPPAGCVPVTRAELFAVPATNRTEPPAGGEPWSVVPLSPPLWPATYPRLLAHVVQRPRNRDWAASWAPGDPMDIDYVQRVRGNEGRQLERKQGRLFTGGLSFGAATIVKPLFGNVVTLRDGDLFAETYARGQTSNDRIGDDDVFLYDAERLPWGSSKLYEVRRGDKLFLLEEQDDAHINMQAMSTTVHLARWSVSVISPDGSVASGILQPGGALVPGASTPAQGVEWPRVEFHHSSDFNTLSVIGVFLDTWFQYPPNYQWHECRWQFDDEKQMYEFVGVSEIAPPSGAQTTNPSERPEP